MTAQGMDTREQILHALLAADGTYISGEEISDRLGITRAAVWKHMRQLQEEGWPMTSVTRKGYRMLPDELFPYTAAGIQYALGKMSHTALSSTQVTESVSWKVVMHDRIGSSSSTLKELAAEGAAEGLVVIAKEQTAGRGRLGRTWASGSYQGIWMSLLLRPHLAPTQVQSLTIAISVAVMDALLETLTQVLVETLGTDNQKERQVLEQKLKKHMGIKWPNDILWKGRKICGILTELAAEPGHVSFVVIGIGLNVNQLESDFPEEVQNIASSCRMVFETLLADIASESWPFGEVFSPDRMVRKSREYTASGAHNTEPGHGIRSGEYTVICEAVAPAVRPLKICMNTLAACLLLHISDVYGTFEQNGMTELLDKWKEYSITLGQKIRVIAQSKEWDAEVLDICEDGRLLVKNEKGQVIELLSGEISIRNLS